MNRVGEVQIRPIKPTNGLLGFASVIFDDCLYLGSIGIYSRPQGGYRLTYPTKKESGLNIFYPINGRVNGQIEEAVISKFEEVFNK